MSYWENLVVQLYILAVKYFFFNYATNIAVWSVF